MINYYNDNFKSIIAEQCSPENKQIYKLIHNNDDLQFDSMLLKIKNNKIVDFKYNNNGWQTRALAYKKLIELVLEKYQIKDCSLKISLGDYPKVGYFQFSKPKNTNKSFLLPNFRFIYDNIVDNKNIYYSKIEDLKSWNEVKHFISNNDIDFDKKRDSFYFAGGRMDRVGTQRNKYFKLMNENNSLFQGNFSVNNKDSFIPFSKHFEYKFIIYLDGETLSIRMRLLLLMNSIPFYCTSQYEELYSKMLKHEINYIQFDDVNELNDVYNKYKSNHQLFTNIIQNNKNFTNNILTFENLLKYTADLINNLNN